MKFVIIGNIFATALNLLIWWFIGNEINLFFSGISFGIVLMLFAISYQ